MAAAAPIPSVCSASVPSAASQLNVAPYPVPGLMLKILSSSSLSRPRGLTTSSQEGGSSSPLVPIWFGHAVVVELADPGHEIAVLLEELRQSDHVGKMLAEIRGVLLNLGHVGALAGPERGPARVAEGEPAIGAIEANPAAGEAVDVR